MGKEKVRRLGSLLKRTNWQRVFTVLWRIAVLFMLYQGIEVQERIASDVWDVERAVREIDDDGIASKLDEIKWELEQVKENVAR